MDEQRYVGIIRVLATIVAIGLWLASIGFSVDGFKFTISEYEWLAYFLGFSVTVIQLVWNREANTNWTIMTVGIVAYGYGIWTNIMGITYAQGTAFGVDSQSIFAIILAIFLEVTPEAILVWGLTGAADLGDFLGNIVGQANVRNYNPKSGRSNKSKPQSGNKKSGNQRSRGSRRTPSNFSGPPPPRDLP